MDENKKMAEKKEKQVSHHLFRGKVSGEWGVGNGGLRLGKSRRNQIAPYEALRVNKLEPIIQKIP
jgi:hypothetical protein